MAYECVWKPIFAGYGVKVEVSMQNLDIFGERRGYVYEVKLDEVSGHVSCINVQAIIPLTRVSSLSSDKIANKNYDLFVNHIWPGSIVMADFICRNRSLFEGKVVLEVGAGAALPSIVADHVGACMVIATDYGNRRVLDNIHTNALNNRCQHLLVTSHVWGDSLKPLFDLLVTQSLSLFDVIIVAECLWKDTVCQHRALLSTINSCLMVNTDAVAYVFFAHRPCEGHGEKQDIQFFAVAEAEFGIKVTSLGADASYADAMDDKEKIEVKMYSLCRDGGFS